MKIIIFFIFSIFFVLHANSKESYKCIASAKKFEKLYKLPENLLVSVALTESGKRISNGEFVAWPWTVNVKGKGKFFNTKEEALKYVSNYLNLGKKNIDIGCMQVNNMYHPNAFLNLEKAFDPESNVEWSANLIKNLYQKYGSYKEAVGYYHSYRTIKKNKYASKVFTTWRKLNKNDVYANLIVKFDDQHSKPKNSVNKKISHTNLNIQKKRNLQVFEKKDLLKKANYNETTKVNSAYIIARMEKVKFFRNYFLK